jgi:hypothetical protein
MSELKCEAKGEEEGDHWSSHDFNLHTKFPREIAYSQCSITEHIFAGENNPAGASVKEWKNEVPYSIPLDVVTMMNGEYCSYDNRRLFSARNYAPTSHNALMKIHDFKEPVPSEKLEYTGAGEVIFWWMNDSQDAVYVLESTLLSWGFITALRCAYQHPEFPLVGSHQEPVIQPFPQFSPSYRVESNDQKLTMDTLQSEEGLAHLQLAVDEGRPVFFSRSIKRSAIMLRPDFIDFVLHQIDAVSVTSFKEKKQAKLVLRGGADHSPSPGSGDNWPPDSDISQYDMERDCDIDRRWIELDLAEVYPFAFAFSIV